MLGYVVLALKAVVERVVVAMAMNVVVVHGCTFHDGDSTHLVLPSTIICIMSITRTSNSFDPKCHDGTSIGGSMALVGDHRASHYRSKTINQDHQPLSVATGAFRAAGESKRHLFSSSARVKGSADVNTAPSMQLPRDPAQSPNSSRTHECKRSLKSGIFH